MKTKRRITTLKGFSCVLFCCVALVGACDEEVPVAPECAEGPAPDAALADVQGTIELQPQDAPLSGMPLMVSGSANHLGGLTIREIYVGGAQAQLDGFNFQRWSVQIPYETLLQLPVVSEDEYSRTVAVEAVAIDACEHSYTFASFEVEVDPSPGVQMDSLYIQAELPLGADYLPEDGSVPAVLTISGGNPQAAGAVVQLDAPSGTFVGVQNGAVVLAGDGVDAPAQATVLYYAEREGAVMITASSEGHVATRTLDVAGPPSLLPGFGQLPAGGSLSVMVLSAGTVDHCQANPVAGISVTSGGADLMSYMGATDENGDGHVDIMVAISEDLEEQAEVLVTCSDPFGQSGTGSYVGLAAPPEEDADDDDSGDDFGDF